MDGQTEEKIRKELAVYIESRTLTDSSTVACRVLQEYVKSTFKVDSDKLDRFTAAVIFVAALKDDLPDGASGDRRPLRASRHFFALGHYPRDVGEIEPDTGRTMRALMVTKDARPRKSLSMRRQIAVIAGGYGTTRASLQPKHQSGKANHASVVGALWKSIKAIKRDPGSLAEIEAMIGRIATATRAAHKEDDSDVAVKRAAGTRPFDLTDEPPLLVGRDAIRADLASPMTSYAYLFTGDPGVGKTSLAVAVAHRWAIRYPDGRIQLDLCAYSDKPTLSTAEAVRSILGRFGLEADKIPDDEVLLLSAYRTFLRKRRVLILADNVADPETVRALAPGSNSTLIVTSRSSMPTLATRMRIKPIPVERLAEPEGREVLSYYVGGIATSDLALANEIVRLCDRLPQALTIVGAKMGFKGRDLATTAGGLSDARDGVLGEKLPDSDLTMTAVLDWSLNMLTSSQQDLLVALANLPLRFVSEETIPDLGFEPDDVDVLVNEHLVIEVPWAETYVFHDLTRQYLRTDRVRAKFAGANSMSDAVNSMVRSIYRVAAEALAEIRNRRDVQHVSDLPTSLPLIDQGISYVVSEQWYGHAINLLDIGRWAHRQDQHKSAVAVMEISVELLHRLGELETATVAISDLFQFLDDWGNADISEAGASLSPNGDLAHHREMALLLLLDISLSVKTYAARTGWTSRMTPILRNLDALEAQTGIGIDLSTTDAWQRLFASVTPDTLIRIVKGRGEVLDLRVEDPTEEQYNHALHQLASLEQVAELALASGDEEGALVVFNRIYDLSKSYAETVPTLDVLWSVEPPLIRYAQGLLDASQPATALGVLRWVERLYASRFSFYGHWFAVHEWAEQVDRELPSKKH